MDLFFFDRKVEHEERYVTANVTGFSIEELEEIIIPDNVDILKDVAFQLADSPEAAFNAVIKRIPPREPENKNLTIFGL